MIVILPRGVEVDTNDVPADFEYQIQDAFGAYTEGTAPEYTFQDKLCFIDNCIEKFHNPDLDSSEDVVMDYLKDRFEYDITNGEFPSESEYYSFETMVDCYELGKKSCKMYSHDYEGDKHDEEKIEQVIIRIIKAVLDWKGN